MYGAVAQLGERYNGIVEAEGSIPFSSISYPETIPSDRAWDSYIKLTKGIK